MSAELTTGHGAEKSIYLVGGLGLGLLGIEELVSTSVNIYGGTYNPSGHTLTIAPPTEAGWVAGLVVGMLFLLGGAYLLVRAWRLGPSRPTRASHSVASPQ